METTQSVEDLPLACHIDCQSHGVDAVSVSLGISQTGRLWLRYHIEVLEEELALPGPAAPHRTDGLWRATCCEFFLRRLDQPGYIEFNFSPSSQWAAYYFAAYRDGGEALPLIEAPQIFLDASASHFALEVEMELPQGWETGPLLANIAAVIEESDGTKSYWALRHPPGAPDFHHPDCFALTLGAPDAA